MKKKIKNILIDIIGYSIATVAFIGLIYLFVFVVGTIFKFLGI